MGYVLSRHCLLRGVTIFFQVFLLKIVFASLCSFICLQVVYQLQDPSTNLLGVAALRMLLLTSFPYFVIDFLSITKFLAASSTTMESLPLNELDFGLQQDLDQ